MSTKYKKSIGTEREHKNDADYTTMYVVRLCVIGINYVKFHSNLLYNNIVKKFRYVHTVRKISI